MASLPNPKTVTYEEWLRMSVTKDAIEEVVDGKISIMPLNKWDHTEIVDNLRDALVPQLERREFRVTTPDFGLILRKAPLTVRNPDLTVFRRSTIVVHDGYVHSAPLLFVEVMSRSNRAKERMRLRQDYASPGVPEYWEVWPENRSIEVLNPENGLYQTCAVLTQGTLKPREFPHVQVDISTIWPDRCFVAR